VAKKTMSLRRKIIAVVAALVFLTIALSVFWGYRALTFPWLETAGRLPKGEFAFSKAPSQPESEIVAAASLRAGVIWIDEFVLHEGIGVAFGPFGRYAVLEPGNFPHWHITATGSWRGQRGDFDFPKFAELASVGDP
jgi:hypothetical protein